MGVGRNMFGYWFNSNYGFLSPYSTIKLNKRYVGIPNPDVPTKQVYIFNQLYDPFEKPKGVPYILGQNMEIGFPKPSGLPFIFNQNMWVDFYKPSGVPFVFNGNVEVVHEPPVGIPIIFNSNMEVMIEPPLGKPIIFSSDYEMEWIV